MTYRLITANRNYSSWSLRPWLLMTALELPFEDEMVLFEAENYANFRRFAPNGQVPCLKDHREDGSTQTIWDSLAIVEYLAERHDGCWPTDSDARTWARCAAAEMHGGFSALRNQCPMNVGVRAKLHDIDPALQRDLHRIGELFAQGIADFGGPWLAGEDFTIVDAFYAPVAFRIRTFGLDVGGTGNAWVDHILAHPAMQHWEAQALAEPYRETSHEDEIAVTASLTDDFRLTA